MTIATFGPFKVSGTTQELEWSEDWYDRSLFPWTRIDRTITITFTPPAQMPPLPPSVGSGPRQGSANYSADRVLVLRGMSKVRTTYVLGHETFHVPIDSRYLNKAQRDALTALMEPASVARTGWTAGPSDKMPAEVAADRGGEFLIKNGESPFDNDVVYQGTIPNGRAKRFLDILLTPPDYDQIQRQLVTAREVAITKTQEVGQVTEMLSEAQTLLTVCEAELGDCLATPPLPDDCQAEIDRLTAELIACRAAGEVKDADIVRYRGALEAIEDRAASALMGEGEPPI